MKRFFMKMFRTKDDQNNKTDHNVWEMHSAEIKKHAKKMNQYPVSPFFKQRVLAHANAMEREVWDYFNILPQSKMRLAMITLILLIVTIVNIPVNDQETLQVQPNNDFQYLVSGETSNQNLDTPDKVLQFTLSN